MSAIFLSHSSADNEAADRLRRWLDDQGYRSFFLDFHPEQGIPAGRDWEKELYAQLRACRAIIVLCSPHSMASTWCFAEITHARALGKAIFPVKIVDCPIHSLLATLQVLDLTVGNGNSLDRLAHGLKAAGLDPTDSFDWDTNRPPYPGLPAFDEPDAAVFFGRENEICEGLDTLSQQHSFGGARFLLVLGASGSGKSSLLRAGLIPRLRRSPEQWIIVPPFRPLGRPFESLAYALSASFEKAERREWNELHRLISDGAGEPLATLGRELQFGVHRPEATVLLCIDQLEELFTLSGREEAERFLGVVRAAAEARASPVLVVATLRSDFLGALQSQAALREASFAQLLVNPMALGRIGQIIEGPAAVANLELEPGLVQAMLRDTEAESALPLLAFTLRELWEHRLGDRLTIEVYRDQLGGLSGAVAKAAEGVLTGAGAVASLQETQLRQAFLSLVRVNEEGRFTRRPANWADLPEAVHPLLERFVQARLLISRQDGAARTLEVAHEALFRAWGRLAAWLDQDRSFLLWRKRLDQALEFWTEGGKSRERLLTGALLRESEAQLKEHGDPLGNDERGLIVASVAADRRARRIRTWIVAGVVSLIVAAGGFAGWQAIVATEQRHLAIARQLATEARVALDQGGESARELQRSLLLATASLKFAWTQDGFEAWSKAIELTPKRPSVILDAADGPYTYATFSADGSRLAAAGKDSIFVIDSASLSGGGSPKIVAKLPQPGATALAFSPPNGALLASGVGNNVVVWNMGRQERVKELPGDGHRVESIAFDSGGKRLASAGMNYYARVFDTDNWTELGWVGNVAALAVAFPPDDHWLLTSGPTVVAWDLATAIRRPGNPRAPADPKASIILGPNDPPYFLSFNSDGHWLATGKGLWSVVPPQADKVFAVSEKSIFDRGNVAAINSDASLAATNVSKGEFATWQVIREKSESNELFRILPEANGEGSVVAFGPTGKWLVSASDRLELWDLSATAEFAPLQHGAGVLAVAVSPNGNYLATTTVDGYAHIWRTSDWTEMFKSDIRESDADHASSNIAFSSDNLWVAATSQNVLKIFSAEGWRQVTEKAHEHTITNVAFSPDARWLITVENDPDVGNANIIAINSWQMAHLAHGKRISAVSISPDGRWIASKTEARCLAHRIGSLGLARVWQISDGELQASMPIETTHECDPSDEDKQMKSSGNLQLISDSADWAAIPFEVESPVKSRDGLWSAEWDWGNSIKLSASGGGGRPPIMHRAGATAEMAFSRDGRWLVSAGRDGVARVWALSTKDIVAQSCERLTHDLSEDDWHRYLGKETYVPLCRGLPPLRN